MRNDQIRIADIVQTFSVCGQGKQQLMGSEVLPRVRTETGLAQAHHQLSQIKGLRCIMRFISSANPSR